MTVPVVKMNEAGQELNHIIFDDYFRTANFGGSSAEHTVPVTGRDARTILKGFGLTADFFKGKTVLDIGCGRSLMHKNLVSDGCTPAQSVVLDGRLEAIDFQRRFNPGVIALQGSATELPFKNDAFEIVYSNFCMPIWAKDATEVRQFFDEARRVLRPDGVLAINAMVNFSRTDKQTATKIKEALIEQNDKFEDPSRWIRRATPGWDIVVAKKVA